MNVIRTFSATYACICRGKSETLCPPHLFHSRYCSHSRSRPLSLKPLRRKREQTDGRRRWSVGAVFLPSRSAHPSIDIKRLSRLTRCSNSYRKNSFLLLLYCSGIVCTSSALQSCGGGRQTVFLLLHSSCAALSGASVSLPQSTNKLAPARSSSSSFFFFASSRHIHNFVCFSFFFRMSLPPFDVGHVLPYQSN